MESRRVPGLFLAGEVLDIDGITGGYNFQARPRVAPARTRRRQERLSVALLRIRVMTPHPSHDAASESCPIRVTSHPSHAKPHPDARALAPQARSPAAQVRATRMSYLG